MNMLRLFLMVLLLSCAVSAAAQDANGFRDFTWGASLESIQKTEPKMVQGMMGTMPGVQAFKRGDDELEYGGVKVDSITYYFYHGRFTSVGIEFRGFDTFERLLAHCKKVFGPVTGGAVLRLEQYASFDTPTTGAMLIYQLSMQTTNYGRLYLYSKELLK